MIVSPPNQPPQPKSNPPVGLALRIVSDFGATIAVPVVFFGWLGHKADIAYQTKPILTIIGFALASALSAVSIYRKAKKYARLYKNL